MTFQGLCGKYTNETHMLHIIQYVRNRMQVISSYCWTFIQRAIHTIISTAIILNHEVDDYFKDYSNFLQMYYSRMRLFSTIQSKMS